MKKFPAHPDQFTDIRSGKPVVYQAVDIGLKYELPDKNEVIQLYNTNFDGVATAKVLNKPERDKDGVYIFKLQPWLV